MSVGIVPTKVDLFFQPCEDSLNDGKGRVELWIMRTSQGTYTGSTPFYAIKNFMVSEYGFPPDMPDDFYLRFWNKWAKDERKDWCLGKFQRLEYCTDGLDWW